MNKSCLPLLHVLVLCHAPAASIPQHATRASRGSSPCISSAAWLPAYWLGWGSPALRAGGCVGAGNHKQNCLSSKDTQE